MYQSKYCFIQYLTESPFRPIGLQTLSVLLTQTRHWTKMKSTLYCWQLTMNLKFKLKNVIPLKKKKLSF